MLSYLAALGVGLLAGTHTATWGMYKDAPHEGFRHYPRSIILAAIAAPLLAWVAHLNVLTAPGIVVLFGVTYCVERGLSEFYKTFVRVEDQSKYTIPMQFHVLGKVVHGDAQRWAAAAIYVVMYSLAAWGVSVAQTRLGSPNPAMFLLFGSAGGWLSAFGGAFKDAPIEGFQTLKFFRSPLIAAGYALLLSCWTDNYLLVAAGALGYTIATIETYKTFFFPSKPRGKFANKPILHPEHLETRKRYVPLYAGIWLFVIVSVVLAFLGPERAGG
jgi:hypothetical protein